VIVAMLVAAVAASIAFDSQAPLFAWIAATFAFEFWWKVRKPAGAAPARVEDDGPLPAPIIVVDQPWIATRGVAFLWSVATAVLFTFFAHATADISLLGVPYWIPLGPAIIGNIGPRGLSLGYRLFGGRRAPRLRSVLAYAVLTMILLYLFQYMSSGQSYTAFMSEYFAPGGSGNRTDFNGLAPVPALTPLIQLIGYLAGGAILTLPTSRR
jgi:hypothetical protein